MICSFLLSPLYATNETFTTAVMFLYFLFNAGLQAVLCFLCGGAYPFGT